MTENTAENEMPENNETDNVEELQPQQPESDDPVTQLTKERDDMRDKMMRALAETDNTRKRAEKMQSDTQKYAVSGFAKDMLDIADNLRRALDAISDDQLIDANVKTLHEGVAATERVMLSNLEKHGVKKIEPTSGKFDPNFHEVMFEGPAAGVEPGEIIQLLEAGYILHDRLLRPARVGVAKSSEATEHSVDTEA